MKIPEFLKTVYVGDRACKAVLIDGWNAEVKVQVTCISRVRSAAWDYYSAEDLENGFIVLIGVKSVVFEPSGLVPNDLINEIRTEKAESNNDECVVIFSIDSVDCQGSHTEVQMRIVASSMALEAYNKPGASYNFVRQVKSHCYVICINNLPSIYTVMLAVPGFWCRAGGVSVQRRDQPLRERPSGA